jgi:hypothetical protein
LRDGILPTSTHLRPNKLLRKDAFQKGFATPSRNLLSHKRWDRRPSGMATRVKFLSHLASNPAGSAILFDTNPFSQQQSCLCVARRETNDGKLRCRLALNRSYSL